MVTIQANLGSGAGNTEQIIVETIIKSMGYKQAQADLKNLQKITDKLIETTNPRLMEKYNNQLETIRQNIQQNTKKLSDPTYLNQASKNYQTFFQNVRAQGDDFVSLRTVQDQTIVKSQQKFSKGLVKNMKYVVDANGNLIDSQIESVEKARDTFNFGYLSVMFFGMALRRVSQSIIKTTMSAFTKIADGATEASRAVTVVSAEFEFMKFEIGRAIGEALVPLLPIIQKITRGFADFVQQHPEATFYSIASVLAVGGAMSMLGQVGLFLQGLKEFTVSNEWTAFAGPNGSLARVSSLAMEGLTIGLGFYFIKELIQDFSKKDYEEALTDMLFLTSIMMPAGKTAGVLGLIGLGFTIINNLRDGQEVYDALANAFSIGGITVFAKGGALLGPVGAAFATIGIAMSLMGAEQFLSAASALFAFVLKDIVTLSEIIISVLIAPIDKFIQGLVDIYNKIGGFFGAKPVDYDPFSVKAIANIESQLREWEEQSPLLPEWAKGGTYGIGTGIVETLFPKEWNEVIEEGAYNLAGPVMREWYEAQEEMKREQAKYTQPFAVDMPVEDMGPITRLRPGMNYGNYGYSSAYNERVFTINELNVNLNENYTDASSFLESLQAEVSRST